MKLLLIIPLLGCIIAASYNDGVNAAREAMRKDLDAHLTSRGIPIDRNVHVVLDVFFVVLILYFICFWWLILLSRMLKHLAGR